MSLKKLSADDFSSVVNGRKPKIQKEISYFSNDGGSTYIGGGSTYTGEGSTGDFVDVSTGDTGEGSTGEIVDVSTGDTGGGSTYTGETGGFDFEKAVRSPYGLSELNNYLYDSGLQNVFKDYQENIASLNASEQQKLEDAYYLREMSKKYLGEYASNTGIGDVSGNLLDIYGNYQKSKADIKTNYDALELNLTQEYRAEKTALFNEKMKEQYNMELADFSEGSQEIMFNAVTGNYDTELYADGFEYLDAMKESEELLKSDYQTAYGTLYKTMLDRIQTNLENENYEGFSSAEEYINSFGKLIDADKSMLQGISNKIDKQNQITDIIKNLVTENYGEGVEGLDYLESVRETIGPEAYQTHYAKIYAKLYQEAFEADDFNPETTTIDEYVQSYVDRGLSTTHAKELKEGLATFVENYENAKIDVTIGREDSENYVGDDYNFKANTGGENVSSGSYMYKDANGVRTFAVLDDSEADGAVSGWYASHEDVSATFRGENDGKNPKTGDEVEFSAYNAETEETQTFSYVFENGRWHRLVQENPILDTDMALWKNTEGTDKFGANGRKITTGEGFEIDNRYDGRDIFDWKHWNEPDTFTYKGIKYVEGKEYTGVPDGLDGVAGADSRSGDPYTKLRQLFNDVHGDPSTGDAVVYYNNNFYIRKKNGKIHIMNEEKKKEK